MNTVNTVTVFDDADLIRDSLVMYCRDKVSRPPAEDVFANRQLDDAISKLCWEMFSLQGKKFPFKMLVEKTSAVLLRSNHPLVRSLNAEEVAHEISSCLGGW